MDPNIIYLLYVPKVQTWNHSLQGLRKDPKTSGSTLRLQKIFTAVNDLAL